MIARDALKSNNFKKTVEECPKMGDVTKKGSDILKYIDLIADADHFAKEVSESFKKVAKIKRGETKKELEKKALQYVNKNNEPNRYALAFWSDDVETAGFKSYAHYFKQVYDGINGNNPVGLIQKGGNVISAFKEAFDYLSSKGSSPKKSHMLAHMIHMMGDMHNPLHMITRKPAGSIQDDKAGMEVVVKGLPFFKGNLHQLWDKAFGIIRELKQVDKDAIAEYKKVAKKIMAEVGNPKDIQTLRISNFDEFKSTMFKIGAKSGYGGIAAKELRKEFDTANSKEVKDLIQLCKKLIATAGYRTALYFSDIYFANHCR
eukprot:TRINITY_DN706_c0_g1_i20.p1 TRINITY_DN706_c0_g1~~TRINITY_DN706_c0_g1_i20.p1  ORF type:complete len:348 (+),score=119.59 TRINITY_DN706_c0_g1_i20:94-1044(+)